jgi:hypothetical protein
MSDRPRGSSASRGSTSILDELGDQCDME